MLQNYLITALRSLLRHRAYAAINLLGLAIGMACCLLLFRYVAFQLSFDRFHEKADQLYLGVTYQANSPTSSTPRPAWPYRLGPTIHQERPEVEDYARVVDLEIYGGEVVVSATSNPNKAFSERRLVFADPSLLKLFSFPLLEGDAEAALTEPGTLLLSASMARKYFGRESPIGKVMQITGFALHGPYEVRGVFQDVPVNSHLQVDFLLPIQDLLTNLEKQGPDAGSVYSDQWSFHDYTTYLQLKPGARRTEIERALTETFRRHLPAPASWQSSWRMGLTPLKDVYLHTEAPSTRIVTFGSARIVYFATVLGLFILVLAWVNYVNLTTARSLQRAREVGVRKVVGAGRLQLMGQFLLESALVNAAAFALALALSEVLFPLVERLAGISLPDQDWGHPGFWAAAVVLFLFGTVVAGLYPAFILSSFRPATVLKSSGGRLASRLVLRKALVVFQFTVSVVLLIGLYVTYAQLGYMRKYDLGINLEQILVVPSPMVFDDTEGDFIAARLQHAPALKRFQTQMEELPAVRAATSVVNLPGEGFLWNDVPARRAGSDRSAATPVNATLVGMDFVRTFGLEIVAGRDFSEDFTTDQGNGNLLTEEAVRQLGFASNEAAVGQTIELDLQQGTTPWRIIGVVKDFHWSSLHQGREPLVLGPWDSGRVYCFRVGTERLPETIAAIEAKFKQAFPGNPFEYYFLDEVFNEQYRQDERFASLFGVFASLAVLIACLGLFGLSAFTAEQRTKEIGVRKVLGASVAGLVTLLSKDFLGLVLVAVVVASPIAYFWMSRWLEGFAYRIELGPGIFLLSGGAALVIALLTVSYQAIKASLADPVKSLRYE